MGANYTYTHFNYGVAHFPIDADEYEYTHMTLLLQSAAAATDDDDNLMILCSSANRLKISIPASLPRGYLTVQIA